MQNPCWSRPLHRAMLLPLTSMLLSCDAFADSGCDNLEDETATHPITLNISNSTDTTKLLGSETGCGQAPVVAVEFEGQLLDLLPEPCHSCENLSERFNCSLLCRQPEVIAVLPGESTQLNWNATFAQHRLVPSSCGGDNINGNTRCDQVMNLPPGTYQVRLLVKERVLCEDAGNVNCPQGATVLRETAQLYVQDLEYPQQETLDFEID